MHVAALRVVRRPLTALCAIALAACGGARSVPERAETEVPAAGARTAAPPFEIRAGRSVESDPRESHLRNIRQLTFGGENAEAYWSPDGRKLIFQATREEGSCDQEYVLDLESGEETLVSTGRGRTTCGFFAYPDGDWIVYSSTHEADADCPPPPDRSQGYVWPLDEYDVFRAAPDGSDLRPLVRSPGYDAEATFAFDGSRIVLTSDRHGDLELYTIAPDGSDLTRLTHTPGYDGGAFFSPDGRRIVWRASRPEGEALEDYRALLERDLVRPSALEIFVANADGSAERRLTRNGAANFAPSFLPDSRRVIFSSNVGPSPREFDLHLVDPDEPPGPDGTPPVERITFSEGFDGFPLFSPDGRWLAFSSNRHGSRPGETNVFVAEWAE